MLETALLTAHAAHLQTPAERLMAWEMVAANAAALIDTENDVEAGARAVFNVFPPAVTDRHEALRLGRPPRTVVHDGEIVAENRLESTVGDA